MLPLPQSEEVVSIIDSRINRMDWKRPYTSRSNDVTNILQSWLRLVSQNFGLQEAPVCTSAVPHSPTVFANVPVSLL